MWRRRFVVGALIALAASGSFACSLLLGDDSPQCRVDNDCAARGFAGAVCVAEVCQPAPADAGIAVEASSDAGVAVRPSGAMRKGNARWRPLMDR